MIELKEAHMCTCIEDINKKYSKEKYRKPFESIELNYAYLASGKSRLFSTALITLKGQQKQIEIRMLHTFCPFCGEKIK